MRAAVDLCHSALEVTVPAGRFRIERGIAQRRVRRRRRNEMGGAIRVFRYEIRRWRHPADGMFGMVAAVVVQ